MSIFEGDLGRAADAEVRGTGFRMTTNIKARPGSQGTLFQGGKPVAQHRWPRGYSPMRMASVSTMFGEGTSRSPRRITTQRDIHADPEDPLMSHPHYNPFSQQHSERLMLEPLARSSVPLEHFSTLRGIHMNISESTRPGEHAHYSPTNASIQVNRQPFLAHDEHTRIAMADSVLLHEVGHHIDIQSRAHDIADTAARHPQGFEAGFEAQRGDLERRADEGMIKHFRNDPRNQRRSGFDVRKETYGGRGVGHLAGAGYRDPGAAPEPTDHEWAQRDMAVRREVHTEKTGETFSPSMLHPGQFDRQGSLF